MIISHEKRRWNDFQRLSFCIYFKIKAQSFIVDWANPLQDSIYIF